MLCYGHNIDSNYAAQRVDLMPLAGVAETKANHPLMEISFYESLVLCLHMLERVGLAFPPQN